MIVAMDGIKYVKCKAGRYIDNGDGTYRCPQCGFIHTSRIGLAAHMVGHQDLHLKCQECGREFRNRRALGRHMGSSHKAQEPVVCDACGETFRNKRALGNHKAESHDYLVSRTCEMCGRSCSGWASYQNHLKFAHGNAKSGGASGRSHLSEYQRRKIGDMISILKRVWWLTATDEEKAKVASSAHTDDADAKRRSAAIRTWESKTVDDLADIHHKTINGRSRFKYYVANKSGEDVGCDSLTEAGLCEAMLLDESVRNFMRCPDVIPVIGMRATYNPDFTVEHFDGTVAVIEVKGRAGWNDEQSRRLPFKTESAVAFYVDKGITYRIMFADDVADYRESFVLNRRASAEDKGGLDGVQRMNRERRLTAAELIDG